MKTIITFSGLLLLTGCAGSYTFRSNLDKQNFKDYFKAGEVRVFHAGDLPMSAYQTMGSVTGEACQTSDKDKAASEEDARTEARKAAADLGADGIIIRGCAALNESDSRCLSHVLCSGQAVKINAE